MSRKGFNFYASYFDVYNQLKSDKDKLSFIDALLNRQFQGIEPTNLKGLAEFAYISQKHSIDAQIKGWEDKTKQKLTPTEGGSNTPTEQEKGKEKGKGKEKPFKEKVKSFIVWFNNKKEKHTGLIGKFKALSTTDENNLKKLLESYNQDDFNKAIPNLFKSEWAKNNNGFSPTHFLRVDNFNKYLNAETTKPKPVDENGKRIYLDDWR